MNGTRRLEAPSGSNLDLLELQTFAVEARYEEGPFHLPAEHGQLLRKIEALERNCRAAIAAVV